MEVGKNTRALIVATFFLALLSVPVTADAYIDPGTGSLIIQTIIASVAAIGLATKIFWHKIRGVFSKSDKGTVESDSNEQQEQQQK